MAERINAFPTNGGTNKCVPYGAERINAFPTNGGTNKCVPYDIKKEESNEQRPNEIFP